MLTLVFWVGQALCWMGIGVLVVGTKLTTWAKVHREEE